MAEEHALREKLEVPMHIGNKVWDMMLEAIDVSLVCLTRVGLPQARLHSFQLRDSNVESEQLDEVQGLGEVWRLLTNGGAYTWYRVLVTQNINMSAQARREKIELVALMAEVPHALMIEVRHHDRDALGVLFDIPVAGAGQSREQGSSLEWPR